MIFRLGDVKMDVEYKGRYIEYKRNGVYRQYRLLNEPVEKTYVSAVLLYDSKGRHEVGNEQVELDWKWVCTYCTLNIPFDPRICVAKTVDRENDTNALQRIIVKGDWTDGTKDVKIQLYKANPNCKHLIRVSEFGYGVRCVRCSGWHCGKCIEAF